MSLDLGPQPIRLRGGGLRLPRHKGRRVLLAGLGMVLFVLLVGWFTGGTDVTPAAKAQEQDGTQQGGVADELAVVPSGDPVVFATVDGLELWSPSGATLLVAYHEASFDDALAIKPTGRLRNNFNTTKYTDPGVTPGPVYDIQASRGRTHDATTAVDLVLRDDETVRSPVSGTVVEVRPYSLYGRYADTRIEIAPAGRPELRIVLIHVADVQVNVGDELVAGESPIAGTANRFPFHSQVDRHLPDGPWPHVHVEVKRA
jgi:hypothetical protein